VTGRARRPCGQFQRRHFLFVSEDGTVSVGEPLGTNAEVLSWRLRP
jgi:hypothetical protein